MKTLIQAAALVMVCIVNLQAQDSSQLLAPVAKGFQREFAGATRVSWEQVGQLSMARFQYNDGTWIAYFDKEGTMVASGRKIADVKQLPVAVQRGLAREQQKQERKYGSFSVGAPYELLNNGSTLYFLPIENSSISMVITSDISGTANIQKRNIKRDRTEPATPMLAATNRH